MFIHTQIFARFLIFGSFLVLADSSNSEICINSACHSSEPQIRFPFRIQGNQPKQCGFPGFDLTCDSSRMTTLQLQNSSSPFSVQAIDYASQEIWLNDPDHCLPRRLLTLNLSGTPFRGVYVQDFTLFNCSFNYGQYSFNPIACMSGSTYTVIATSSGTGAVDLSDSSCTWITTISVPVQWAYYERVWSSDLGDDIRLTWDAPRCGRCESRGGRCGLKDNSSQDIECRIRHGLPRGARYAIIVGTAIPALVFVIGFMCFIISRIRACASPRSPVMEATSVVAPQPIVISGLDEAVIESFPKTVLGESKSLPNPEDNLCPICLGEYRPKETLRTIPACQHRFHSNCIDEWLRLNATCPVCRKNQKQPPTPPESSPAIDLNV